jgi:hypothetical protein
MDVPARGVVEAPVNAFLDPLVLEVLGRSDIEVISTSSCDLRLSNRGGEGVGEARDSVDRFVREDIATGGVAPVTFIAGRIDLFPAVVAFHCSLVNGDTVSIAFNAPPGLAKPAPLLPPMDEMEPDAFLASMFRPLAREVGFPSDMLEKGLSTSTIGEGGRLL